ncbi:hypothetical protein EUBDOL_00756 [Amedibacillus dolichus DSM 3991]|uniref:Uncharacterized protein n=1 Tax=Amedibacillus dolichus DSM 3991 TaxID=428127 RepID=A8RAA6_9FIRM|nr:hypothetical protein EUBDOL_00756 [Amedibacillus dolichus DSM 3991]
MHKRQSIGKSAVFCIIKEISKSYLGLLISVFEQYYKC